MNPSPRFLLGAFLVVFSASVFAQIPEHVAVITLGYGIAPTGNRPIIPVHLTPGTRLQLKTGYGDSAGGTIRWFRNFDQIPGTSHSLDIGRVSESDSGLYVAEIDFPDGRHYTHAVPIRVNAPVRQQLLALSTRATISPSSPIVVGGVVIAPSPGALSESKTILLRAVGPSLSTVGVTNPLPTPTLKLFNRHGVNLLEGNASIYYYGHWIPEPDPALMAARLGAFPLTPGAADVARVIRLPAGAYTAHVASATNQTGDILLEIYEVPDEVLQDLFVPVPPPFSSSVGSSVGSVAPAMAAAPSAPIDLPPVAPSGLSL